MDDMLKIESETYGDVENDQELLEELLALEAEETAKRTTKSIPVKSENKEAIAAVKNIGGGGIEIINEKIISSLLKDIGDDNDNNDELLDDNNDNIDDDNNSLLDELSNLIATNDNDNNTNDKEKEREKKIESKIKEKEEEKKQSQIKNDDNNKNKELLKRLNELNNDYCKALKTATANSTNNNNESNSAKIRRYERAINKINELTKCVNEGKSIDENEIPSAIAARIPPIQTLITKQQESKKDVKSVDVPKKLQLDQIKAILERRRQLYLHNSQLANKANDKINALEYYKRVKEFDLAIDAVNRGEVTECDASELPPSPNPYQPPKKQQETSTPKTLIEALEERMNKYKLMCAKNQKENNNRNYRMNNRIVKQYEEAIRAVKSNRKIDLSELPSPPGCKPLAENTFKQPSNEIKPSVAASAAAVASSSSSSSLSIRKGGRVAEEIGPKGSKQNEQLEFLLKRQLLFKQAALSARQNNNIPLAKQYLIASKGFDQMIEASKCGLRVDIKKAPIPPQLQISQQQQQLKPAIQSQQSIDIIQGSPKDVLAALEKDLIRQIKMCDENRLTFTKLGDVTRVKQLEQWSSNCKRDLLFVRHIAQNENEFHIPKFHYENRQFPSIDMCAEINDDHLELEIIRIINAKLPSGWQASDGNIFVKYEFSFPHHSHQTGKTKTVRGTNSPEFNEKITFNINRQSKQLLRVIHRNCLKFEIYQKGCFFRSDRLLGTVDHKLNILEHNAHLHECIDVMEGRRSTGAKIEFKIRIREPIGEKKLNLKDEKWLILDGEKL